MNEIRRLYRSETDRMLGGVCGGIGEYFGVDPTVVRLAFVAATFFLGFGPLLYLVMWIVVPRRSQAQATPTDAAREGFDEVREQARRGAQEARSAYERWRSGSAGQAQPPEQPATPPDETGVRPPAPEESDGQPPRA